MSFTDLIKGRTQKYIKRIPKPGGGYRYIYREHHGGGVANEKHMKEGAAFSLTFNGQKGHFHIISADGDKLTIKHDELHDAEHPGVEMTRAELAALLTREHAPALRENAKKKRDTATRLKVRAPDSLAALAAEKRAKAAEAKLRGEPATKPTQEQEPEGEALDLRAYKRVRRLSRKAERLDRATGRRTNEARKADQSLIEAVKKLLNAAEFNKLPSAQDISRKRQTSLTPKEATKAAITGALNKLERNQTASRERSAAEAQQQRSEARAILEAEMRDRLEAAAPLPTPRDRGPQIKEPPRPSVYDEVPLAKPRPEPSAQTLDKYTAAVYSERSEAKPALAHPSDLDVIGRYQEGATYTKTDQQQLEKIASALSPYIERLLEEHTPTSLGTRGENARYQRLKDFADYAGFTIPSQMELRAPGRSPSEIIRKIGLHLLSQVRLRETSTRGDLAKELARGFAQYDEATRQTAARPSNFETMPESERDYKKAGSVALSRAAKDALAKARGEALLSGDSDKALELREHAEREALYTGAPAVDKVLGAMLTDAERSEEPDGSERTEKSGRLPGGAYEALAAAVESGHLLAHTDGTLTTYRAAPERAAQTEGSSWRLAVRNGDAFTLTLDSFEAVTTKRDSEEAPLEPEPARDAEQVDSILGQLSQLMKANPHLANDPRLAALLGTQGESAAPKTDGGESVLFITGIEGEERTQKARYRLMEAGDVIASHNPLSFATRDDYPEGIQERDYHQNRGEQLKVERNAAHLEPAYLLNTNPDATNGPPIITPAGHVLGGNSRAMSLQLAYGRGGEKGAKYKEALTKQAAAFGFNAADVQALKAPILVRVYEPKDTKRETLARLVRTMNETKTQGLDARIEGRALAAKLTDRTLESIKKGLEKAPEGFSLNRFLTKPSEGLTNVINSLKRDKIITHENAPLYLRDDGTLTGAGREMVALTLAGSVVRDEKTLKAMDYQTFENLTTALGKLAGAGLGPAAKDALESAITIYDQAIRSNLITARGSIQSRLDGVAQVLDQAALFEGASAGDLDVEKHKQKIKENPLASAFLQIFILNKGSAGIDQSMSRFIDLTEQKEQLDLLLSTEPLNYTDAARALVKELAKEHNVSARLFSDIEAERQAAEAAQGSSALF